MTLPSTTTTNNNNTSNSISLTHVQALSPYQPPQPPQPQEPQRPTAFQISLGILMLGASAGLTLYTKKTQSMLNQFKRAEKNKQQRLPKKKFGPLTREEWDKMRNRWN